MEFSFKNTFCNYLTTSKAYNCKTSFIERNPGNADITFWDYDDYNYKQTKLLLRLKNESNKRCSFMISDADAVRVCAVTDRRKWTIKVNF